jgi:hypothetical protein
LAGVRTEETPKRGDSGTVATEASPSDANATPLNPSDALIAVIPSETLAFYIPITATIVTYLLKDTASLDRYMGLRWALYVAGIVIAFGLVFIACPDIRSARPLAEAASAGFAFAAWALITPGSPLLAETRDDLDPVLQSLLGLGSVTVLYVVSKVTLTKKKKS